MFRSMDSRWLGAVVVAVSCLIGCDSAPGAGQERFIPATSTARAAIESAMQAWQRGEPSGEVKGTNPAVFVADAHRQKGQTLERYEILGEVPGDTPRCFLIKLKFAHTEAEKKIRYAVIGIDPLWVFRHDDLQMLTHWDHPMPAPASDKAAATAADERPSEAIPAGGAR